MAQVQLFDGYDADAYRNSDLVGSTLVMLNSGGEVFHWNADRYFMALTGSGLTYGGPNGALLTGGVVTGFSLAASYGRIAITGAHADASVLGLAYTFGDNSPGSSTLLAGDDGVTVTLYEIVGPHAGQLGPSADADPIDGGHFIQCRRNPHRNPL